MPFSQPIIGHGAQLSDLERDVASDNVSHAYLFTGRRHLGKMTVAWWFAAKLLTIGEEDEVRRESLHRIQKLIHPDILSLDQLWMEETCEDPAVIGRTTNITFDHRKKAKAKTDRISIDDVRALQERLFDTATGHYRCCIIRGIERMDDPPANALLKVLEEPPPHMVFLLTTQASASLLPTIVSRCRVLQFGRVPDKALLPLLSALPDDEARFLLLSAQGCPGRLIAMLKDPELFVGEQSLQAQARSFWASSSSAERIGALKMLNEKGEKADRFLFHLFLALRATPNYLPAHVRLLCDLAAALDSNAHRKLMLMDFLLRL